MLITDEQYKFVKSEYYSAVCEIGRLKAQLARARWMYNNAIASPVSDVVMVAYDIEIAKVGGQDAAPHPCRHCGVAIVGGLYCPDCTKLVMEGR
jgi:hypothetical protein